jgi:hypothetical protein
MYVNKLLKIGIPIFIVLLMLVIVGTGIVLAKEPDTSVLTGPGAAYDGYPNCRGAGCWDGGYCPGPGAGYGPGGCCGGNPGNYQPSCHGY